MTKRSTKAKTKAKSKTKTGRLRIGDQWNAINIIARSQTHPLKAVCELTENAIDAKSQHIQIVRRRSKGHIYLEVIDDGNGVSQNDQAEPDFGRIATHICDSMKRHLAADDRNGIHGEFGIGLLSFWSLGEELRMQSAAADGRLFELFLERGKRDYAIRPARGMLTTSGTRVVVGPLLDSTKKVVSGDKLVRYLSTELRDRIRNSGVQIRVVDRVSRKDLLVEPREFEGEPVDVPHELDTAYGPIRVELYFCDTKSPSEGGVAVCKDGTRVLSDVAELVQLQNAPWTERRLEGIFDFGAFDLAPGTRDGIVPDEKLSAFVNGIKGLEDAVIEAFEKREQAESDKASRDILKHVHRAFRNAFRELPSNEYLFFDVEDPKRNIGNRPRVNGSRNENNSDTVDGLPISVSRSDDGEAATPAAPEQPLLPLEPGPLSTVRITPRHPRRLPGEECMLTAVARDGNGLKLDDVGYAWSIMDGEASIRCEGHQAWVNCNQLGQFAVSVAATKDDQSAEDKIVVKYVEVVDKHDDNSAQGLPSYRLEAEHGKPWRSRYNVQKNEIVINSAHRDFLSSRSTGTKHRRYIGKLYAKEVVLINFPHESPAEVMERLIQVTLRTEDTL